MASDQMQANYSQQALWQYDPLGTAVDPEGALLLSPYQQVSARVDIKSASPKDGRWYITLQNVALWMHEPLKFHLRVRIGLCWTRLLLLLLRTREASIIGKPAS